MATESGVVFIDALPYFDQNYEESGVRDAAYALVEEETRRYRPTKNYLEYLPPPDYTSFETEAMKHEFERIASKQIMETLSMKRYELPGPAPSKQNDFQAWTECVENSMAQLEHQATRITNLELMSKYGSNAWRSHNELLTKMVEKSQKQLQDLRKQIQDINWKRKSDQSAAGDQLKNLEASWVGLVSKNYEIERVLLDMEKEIDRLHQEREQIRVHSQLQQQ